METDLRHQRLYTQAQNKKYTCENDVKEMGHQIFTSYMNVKDHPVSQSRFSKKGISDRVICFRGYYIACEYKFGDNKLQVPQYVFLLEVEQAGGLALVINEKNILTLFDILDTLCTLPFAGGALSTIYGHFSLTEFCQQRDVIESFRPPELKNVYYN